MLCEPQRTYVGLVRLFTEFGMPIWFAPHNFPVVADPIAMGEEQRFKTQIYSLAQRSLAARGGGFGGGSILGSLFGGGSISGGGWRQDERSRCPRNATIGDTGKRKYGECESAGGERTCHALCGFLAQAAW